MKTLILIMLLIPVLGFGQTETTDANGTFSKAHLKKVNKELADALKESVFYYWNQYINDCNELVNDTLIQEGKVSIKYVPVLLNGEVSHFKLAPIDTTWTKCECSHYAYDRSNIYLTDQSKWVISNNRGYINTSLSDVNSAVFYSKPIQNVEYLEITRDKICQIKKRKATFEDFWNRYLVEQKIIKTN